MRSKEWHLEGLAQIPGCGRDVRVAVLDTGIAFPAHENWAVEEREAFRLPYPEDRDGHGTHVAGILLSVAPAVHLISITLDEGSPQSYQTAFQLARERSARILNLSGGLRKPDVAVAAGARALFAAGVLLVCAAGNEGPLGFRCPAGLPEVLTVGARRADGTRANFSGPAAEIWAPGVDIWSREIPSGFGFRTGTSQAAAVVSGVAARLLEFEPELTVAELKQHLLRIEW